MRMEMRLAEQACSITSGSNSLHPIGVIGVECAFNIVVETRLVRIESGCKTHPARNAFCRVCESVTEYPSIRGQTIQVRRARVTAHATNGVCAKLIGHEKKNVRSHRELQLVGRAANKVSTRFQLRQRRPRSALRWTPFGSLRSTVRHYLTKPIWCSTLRIAFANRLALCSQRCDLFSSTFCRDSAVT